MNSRRLSICLALVALLCVAAVTESASIARSTSSNKAVASKLDNEKRTHIVVGRQAYSDEDESDEEDDEADIAQAQAQAIIQQQQLGSNEDSGEDVEEDDDDEERRRRRRRRDIAGETTTITSTEPVKKVEMVNKTQEPATSTTPLEVVAAPETNIADQKEPPTSQLEKEPESTGITTAPAPPKKPSVLILIRDALKKVTTLPTEQVATNALQYFQLFEHFLQQTIEEVIGDDDDDEEETTVKPYTEGAAENVYTPVEEALAAIEEEITLPELVTKTPQSQVATSTEPNKIEVHKEEVVVPPTTNGDKQTIEKDPLLPAVPSTSSETTQTAKTEAAKAPTDTNVL